MMNEALRNGFRTHFPYLESEAVEWRENGPRELIVTLSDGSRVSYYDVTRAIRNLPADPYYMSEEECRREFGIRLRRLMSERCVTQTELADETGIGQQSLSNYILGKSTPGFYNVDRIAKALGCSIDELTYR